MTTWWRCCRGDSAAGGDGGPKPEALSDPGANPVTYSLLALYLNYSEGLTEWGLAQVSISNSRVIKHVAHTYFS